LPYAVDAPFNSYHNQHEPTCFQDTRTDLLQEIFDWADRKDERRLFWLNGMAGTGKSTIARTVTRKYFDSGRLGASFFFSRGRGDVGNARKFVTTIAVQLANHVAHVREHICDAITDHGDISVQGLSDQWRQLVLGPLLKADSDASSSSYVIVVDALDECDIENDVQIILNLLVRAAQCVDKVHLKILLTSRPETSIRHGFHLIPQTLHQDVILHDISSEVIEHDIAIFFKRSLEQVALEHALDASWPGEQALGRLVQLASGLFIWAATACKFIREGLSAEERLVILLKGETLANVLGEQLNHIYIVILTNSIRSGYTESE
jgi:hypothetical protein